MCFLLTMCLYLNTSKADKTNSLVYPGHGKTMKVYKLFFPRQHYFPAGGIEVSNRHRPGILKLQNGRPLISSRRRANPTTLSSEEIAMGTVEHGIHAFSRLKMAAASYFAAAILVECIGHVNDFVAHDANAGEIVFHKLTPSKILKHPPSVSKAEIAAFNKKFKCV